MNTLKIYLKELVLGCLPVSIYISDPDDQQKIWVNELDINVWLGIGK